MLRADKQGVVSGALQQGAGDAVLAQALRRDLRALFGGVSEGRKNDGYKKNDGYNFSDDYKIFDGYKKNDGYSNGHCVIGRDYTLIVV